MPFELPSRGVVFWPVGTGDSTTIVVQPKEVILQIDLHHLGKSDDKETPHIPIVDELVRLLPKRNGKPYLSVFALTHPDKDHCQGFEDLLSQVVIGEIWHTPRIFREYRKDLCSDAQKFRDEANRRREITIKNKGQVTAGDRLRVIGHDDGIFKDEKYKDFPAAWRSYPGKTIEVLDGADFKGKFEAFVHAPFKDDSADTRNNTSLALQIALTLDGKTGKVLLFGDREYPTIKQIFDKTQEKKNDCFIEWDVMLCAHHCSKKVMFWKDDNEAPETFRKDIMDEFEASALAGSYIVASCESDFTGGKGDNPPHEKARQKYEGIVDAGHFLCTHEIPNKTKPEPLKFVLDENGFSYSPSGEETKASAKSLAAALLGARGGDKPPREQVGFGSSK